MPFYGTQRFITVPERFSQQYCWRCKISGTWRRVVARVVSSVSKNRGALICRLKQATDFYDLSKRRKRTSPTTRRHIPHLGFHPLHSSQKPIQNHINPNLPLTFYLNLCTLILSCHLSPPPWFNQPKNKKSRRFSTGSFVQFLGVFYNKSIIVMIRTSER